MENVLIKYSDFLENDGGFEQIKRDFKQLGEDLKKQAEQIKGEINIFDLDNADKIKAVEAETEKLLKVWKKYGEAKENITEIETEYNKQIEETTKNTKQSIKTDVAKDKALDNLYIQLEQHKVAMKVINQLYKEGKITDEKYAKAKGRNSLMTKQVTAEIRKQEKELTDLNKTSKAEQKLADARQVLLKNEANNREQLRERIKALRIVVDSLDFETQADEIATFNKEINDLTDVMAENSDKFIQSKINIGNYEESIVNALKGTGLFETQLGGLNSVLEGLLGWLLKTDDAMEATGDTANKNVGAIQKMTTAFRNMNTVLKASIIGVILVAVTALASAFGNTRAGAVRTEKALMGFQSTLANVGQMAQAVFKGIAGVFEIIAIFIEQISKFSLADIISGKAVIASFAVMNAQLANVKKTFQDIGKIGSSGIDAIVKGMEYIDRAYKIEDKIRRTTQEITKLNGELMITQSIADDSTKSLATQLLANEKALNLSEQIGKRQIQIQKDQLEVANNKVKQSILANGVEASNIDLSKTGVAFAQDVLDLAQRRGVSLEIANDLIEQQQSAVVELISAENDLGLTVEENAKKRREIQRDLFEQNLDLLIDLIDTEKNISEQYVNDITKNFQSRINEFNRFIQKFRETSQQQLDEFSKEVANMGSEIDFSIQYDADGNFEVFAGQTKLATDNIVELNKQLQATGMNEIDINRFREFMVETRNGVRDFRLLGKEIKLVGFNVTEMVSNLQVSRDELKGLDALQTKIDALNEQSAGNIPEADRKKLIEQIKALEDERTAIQDQAELARIENRKVAIDAELKTVEEGSERYYQLLQERVDLEKQIRDKAIDGVLDKTKETNDKALEAYKKFSDDVKQVLNAVFDKAVEVQNKRLELAEQLADRQKELIELNQERAQAGLANTLAFEQRELGKREAERIKEEKKKERIEKVRALYSSYSNYASRGDENPIVKALRDFAILEAITASFGDGGIPEDRIAEKNRGIIRGRSHQGRQGGIPILVEGREGIFSSREMDNLGKDNFYKMKDLAGLGKVDSNFFTKQRQDFVQMVPVGGGTDPRVIATLNQVKHAIESKPVPSYEFQKLVDGTMEIVENLQVKNGSKRTVFKTKKSRL